jgi:putative transposase
LRREGYRVNHKRIQRLWREEGLQRPQPAQRKRSRTSPGEVKRLRATYPGHVWAMDFQFDETADAGRLKFFKVVDEFTCQALAIRVGRHFGATAVIDVLEELLLPYGAPTFIRMDNGPEFIAKALQSWCEASGSATAYIPPGSPWENPFIESFNRRFRDEFLNTELFFSLKESQVLTED